MAGRETQSTKSDAAVKKAAAVRQLRARGVEWKEVERRMGMTERHLRRLLEEIPAPPMSDQSPVMSVDDVRFSSAELASCATCPHWLQSKMAGAGHTGRCRARPGLAQMTEDREYCLDHPALVAQRDEALAERIVRRMKAPAEG